MDDSSREPQRRGDLASRLNLTDLTKILAFALVLIGVACGPSPSIEDQAATIVAATMRPAPPTAAAPTLTLTPEPTLPPSATPSPTPNPTPVGGGGMIAFASNQSGNFDIYTIRPDGSGLRRLTDNLLDDQYPAWAPDGSWIAFTSGGKTSSTDLWLMRADGKEQHRLVKGNVYGPSWSPDSRTIVMSNSLFLTSTGWNTRQGLYSSQVDGSNQRFLWVTPGDSIWSEPAWSPVEDVIAASPYLVAGYVTGDLYLIEQNTLSASRLTDAPGEDFGPAWSPDGDRLAFASNRDGNWEIYVMNRDGSGEVRFTQHFAQDWQPTWSPDGRSIAFASNRGGDFDLYVLDVVTGEVTRLTQSLGDDVNPDWGRAG
jgi:TolB protein